MKKTSLKDIAESLGVSKALVSLVMNGKGDERGINKETQERVREKARELNYIPNQYARGLRMGKTNTLGVIVPDISNPFYAQLCKAIEVEAGIAGFSIIICNTFEDTKKERKLIADLLNRSIDGFILASSFDSANEIESLKLSDFPVVLVDRTFESVEMDAVSVDNFKGAQKAVQYLYNKGATKIACLTISPVYISSISQRIKGYLSAVNNEFDAKLIQIRHDKITEDTIKAGNELIDKEYDGVFCVNNTIAKGLLVYMSRNNVSNDKFKIVSFDDNEVFDIVGPKVNSICQPIDEMGKKAVELLINKIENTDIQTSTNLVLETELKER